MRKPLTRGELASLITQTHGKSAGQLVRVATILNCDDDKGSWRQDRLFNDRERRTLTREVS